MVKIIVAVLSLLLVSCSNSGSDSPLKYKWGSDKKIILEDGKIHTNSHFDPVSQQMVGDSLIPFVIRDSSIITTEIVGKLKTEIIEGVENRRIVSDTCITDTLFFEIRNFNGPKLLLYNKNYIRYNLFRPFVLNLLENKGKSIKEFLFVDNKRFEICGLSIGDTLSRDQIKINNVYNYPDYSVENADLISNNDVDLDIIGDKYILKLTQKDITSFDVEDVKKVITAKLGIIPVHTPAKIDEEYETEYYTWNKSGIDITLQRMVYMGYEPLKIITSRDGWNLYYSDDIKSALLINEFKNSSPKSMIIK